MRVEENPAEPRAWDSCLFTDYSPALVTAICRMLPDESSLYKRGALQTQTFVFNGQLLWGTRAVGSSFLTDVVLKLLRNQDLTLFNGNPRQSVNGKACPGPT